jgi:hypothetical protein
MYKDVLKPYLDELKEIAFRRYEEAERLANLIRTVENEAKCVARSDSAEYLELLIRTEILYYEDQMRDTKFHVLDRDEAIALTKLKQAKLE